jgi:uncharacterized SAM-binding protein YcdF (DUF218 family)
MRLPAAEPALSETADGIVALTGDVARVRDALALLAAGKAQRLLITGVNPITTQAEIASENKSYGYLFACCVDLGYEALDTVGNAAETRDWAQRRKFSRALIVVTSTYHMPRALAEMSAAMPHIKLIPYPVDANELVGRPWWTSVHALHLLAREYVKYLFAVARTAFSRGEGPKSASGRSVANEAALHFRWRSAPGA